MTQPIVGIGARCILQVGNQFFLLVEIEAVEQVIVFRITEALATILLNAGVMRCRVVDEIPTPPAGSTLELRCVLVIGQQTFIVFEIENDTEELVLVRADLCTVIS